MMRVGIVGCGVNSNYHISFAKEYKGLKIVGVVDKEEQKAKECANRHGIMDSYNSIDDLLSQQKPEAVHIVTPPQTHFSLAKKAIRAKCHILVEKPLTLHRQEALKLFELAKTHGVKLCTMHNHLYDPWMLSAREFLDKGGIGKIVYLESYYGINTQIPEIMGYRGPNEISWIFDLPGGLFHDFIVHPLYLMLEYTGKPIRIETMTQAHGTLFQNLADELHVMIEGENAIGKLTISFNTKPFQHFLKIYAEKGILKVDFNNMTMVTLPLSKLPRAATKITNNLSIAKQLTYQTISNIIKFSTGKLKPYSGMKILIHNFYDSIRQSTEPPVSRNQALTVIKVADEVWKDIGKVHPIFKNAPPSDSQKENRKEKVLITGAAGFLGRRLIEVLTKRGYRVRAFVRKLSRIDDFKKLGVEIHYGDIRDEKTLKKAIKGMDYIIHAAAAQEGNWDTFNETTIKGTANIFKFAEVSNIKRMIYISSMSVYQIDGIKPGTVLSENAEFEMAPQARGYYTMSKLEADKLVLELMTRRGGVSTVILRPATIYGPSGPFFSPLIGISIFDKIFVILGKKKMELPLVYIDNLVEAILLSLKREKAIGEIFNVIDDKKITKAEYVKYVKKAFPGSFSLALPYWFVYSAVYFQEIVFKMLQKKPIMTRYRLSSASNKIEFSNKKIKEQLGWKPRISIEQGLKKTFSLIHDNK
jgi:predicted dehydrogenase/nucleoside-diphosphate-sugar epimerase